MIYEIIFKPEALEQYSYWVQKNTNIANKIIKLLENISETPFEGIGKPEALKHNLKGCWSRRINKEHRLVYQVNAKSIIVMSCQFHY